MRSTTPEPGAWRERGARALALLALAWGATYLAWRTVASGEGADVVVYVPLLATELFGWVSLALYAYLTWRVPRSERPEPRRAYDVDLYVCTYDEPVAVLRATLLGCRAVRYPHTTWLLDDGRRPEVAALAAELGAAYLTRPDNRHAKAGNINHALAHTQGELIAVLDADHVPLPDFLDAVVGYFDDDDVALVQTPHEFFNHDSIQHGRADRHEQALFFRVLCPARDRRNTVFWCGSAAVLRRRALESVGGVRYETVAEDFHTTIALHQGGWRTRYHDEVLVQGRAPHDLAAFLLQRDRWARGNLRVLRTKESPLTAPGLSAHQRVSYLASLLNYCAGPQRLVALTVLAVTLLTGWLPMAADAEMLLTLFLPWTALSIAATVALGRGRLGLADSTRYGLMTMSIYTVAVASLLSSEPGRFRVTPKQGSDRGGATTLRQLWLLSTIGVVLVAAVALRALWVLGVELVPDMAPVALAVTLGVGSYEAARIAHLVAHLFRRRQLRNDYRFATALAARLGDAVVRVVDVTPGGVGVLAPFPTETSEPVTLHLHVPSLDGGIRELVLSATPRSCAKLGDGTWRIGLRLDDLDRPSLNALTEYCYLVAPLHATTPERQLRPAAVAASLSA